VDDCTCTDSLTSTKAKLMKKDANLGTYSDVQLSMPHDLIWH